MIQKICLIIPCYNEENRLDKDYLLKFIKASPEVHLCFVNDGSSDGSSVLLNKIKSESPDNIIVVEQPENYGKAAAVRTGIFASQQWKEFEFLGYFDADFATPLEEHIHMLNELGRNNALFALGSRIKRLGATVERKLVRHYFGRVFATFASIILDLPVYDTQCGAKIIHKSWIEIAFSEPFISPWLFDIEILARLRNKYGHDALIKQSVEVPLNTWIEMGESKIRLSHLLKVPFELLRIHYKYNRK